MSRCGAGPQSGHCLLSCAAAVGRQASCSESQSLGVKDVKKRTWCEALGLVMQTGLAAWGSSCKHG